MAEDTTNQLELVAVEPSDSVATAVEVTRRTTGAQATYSAKEIRDTLHRQAADYVIRAAKIDAPLRLHSTSLLNWTNPGRTTEQGVVMIWEDAGCPMVVASLFTYEWQGTKVKHELISVADRPLSATYLGRNAWTPKVPGVRWRRIDDLAGARSSLGKAATSKSLRLAQMRQIAREFKVQMKSPQDKLSSLRLMTQPLHRFASKEHGVHDGAIFAYSVATDPEALLLVKADSEGHWHYAFARSTNWQLTATRKGRPVWTVKIAEGLDNNLIANEPHVRESYVSHHLDTARFFQPHPELRKEKP